MKVHFLRILSSAILLGLMLPASAHAECNGGSAPGKMVCNLTDTFNNARRQADDEAAEAAARRAAQEVTDRNIEISRQAAEIETRRVNPNLAVAARQAQEKADLFVAQNQKAAETKKFIEIKRVEEERVLQTRQQNEALITKQKELNAARVLETKLPEPARVVNTSQANTQMQVVQDLKKGLGEVPVGKQKEELGAAIHKQDQQVTAANSNIERLNLLKKLASEEQMHTKQAHTIAGEGYKKPFKDADRLAAQRGGMPSDYKKMSSEEKILYDGSVIETHWVENVLTRERFEYKTILKR